MNSNNKQPSTVEEYINDFPSETKTILENIHAIVKEEAPEVEGKISYGMPTFLLNGKN